MIAGIAAVALVGIGAPSFAADAARPVERYALLVGDNDGGPGRVMLRYAHDDANEMASVLTDLGGVPAGHTWVLLDPDVERFDEVFAEVGAALASANGNAEFVFYYSGHSDEEGLLMGTARVPYRDLRQRLDGLNARVRLAILDSCASGALILSKGGKQVPPFLIDESTQVDGFAYLTSSSADEVAQEAERIGGSYFTHYLASGLRGAADSSGDGRVTLNEAYAYANEETLAQTERTQHGPQHARYETQLSGTGEFVLTDLALTQASLVLDESISGRAMIRDASGALVVELAKAAGRAVEIGLAEGRYTVTFVRDGAAIGEATVLVEVGASTLLASSEVAWGPTEATVARGDVPSAVVTPAPADAEADGENLFRFTVEGPAPEGTIDRFGFGLIGFQSAELGGAALGVVHVETTGHAAGFQGALGWVNAGSIDGVQAAVGATSAREGGLGLSGSFGANVSGGDLDGGQTSAGFNAVHGDLVGGQFTGGVNVVTGGLQGGQLSAGVNIADERADRMRGFGAQVSGGMNVVGGLFDGMQVTGGANIADEIRGGQLSGAYNLAYGGMYGLQTGAVNAIGGQHSEAVQIGGVNVATALDGVQFSLVNYGRDVDGAQIGLVNIAGRVTGTQIGLVNVARSVKGVPVGLLSFEREGRHDLLLFASESDWANAELKFGGDYLYTLLGTGALPGLLVDGPHPGHGYLSFGLGAHLPVHKLWIDLDALSATYVALGTTTVANGEVSGPFANPPTPVLKVRGTLGVQIFKDFAPFVGASLSFQVPTGEPQVPVAPRFIAGGQGTTLVWPGAFAGLAF